MKVLDLQRILQQHGGFISCPARAVLLRSGGWIGGRTSIVTFQEVLHMNGDVWRIDEYKTSEKGRDHHPFNSVFVEAENILGVSVFPIIPPTQDEVREMEELEADLKERGEI